MTSTSQQPKGRDGALSMMNVAIEALNLAKEISSVTPAKAVFGTASVLLVTIRVKVALTCDDKHQIHGFLGLYGQRTGLRRAWVILCRGLRSPGPGVEREAIR